MQCRRASFECAVSFLDYIQDSLANGVHSLILCNGRICLIISDNYVLSRGHLREVTKMSVWVYTSGMDVEKEQLGRAIKQARKSRGLRQEDIASGVGVSAKQVGRWEQGRHT